MNLPLWLDTHLGPPWSGLALIGLISLLVSLSALVAVHTVRSMYPLPEDDDEP